MKLILNFLSLAYFIGSAESAYYCDVFGSPLQGGIGCELEEEAIRAEETQIVLSHYNPPKTASDMVWVEINFSNFTASPKSIFESFPNLKRIEINNCTGLTTIDSPFFTDHIEEIFVVGNDVEEVGGNAFEGLSSLKRLDMTKNKIKSIHVKAFKDLSELRFLNLSFNEIESLEADTFSSNVNLVVIRLSHNKIKLISAQLFAKNTQLNILDINANSIRRIERDFLNGLTQLEDLNLEANSCTDAHVNPSTIHPEELEHLLELCFNNFHKIYTELE